MYTVRFRTCVACTGSVVPADRGVHVCVRGGQLYHSALSYVSPKLTGASVLHTTGSCTFVCCFCVQLHACFGAFAT
jgi:hypothetical protein